MRSFFITATGTGIGKTLVTTSLCHQLKNANKSVAAIKPVISGFDENDDTAQIIRSLGESLTNENINKVSPWRLKAPLSPNMAAAREGIKLSATQIANYCQGISEKNQITLIEGVGGIMVPLNNSETILDLMNLLKIPAILVIGSYLGSINHALLSVEVLKSAGIKIQGIVLSESEESPVAIEETAETISSFTKTPIAILPRITTVLPIWQHKHQLTQILE